MTMDRLTAMEVFVRIVETARSPVAADEEFSASATADLCSCPGFMKNDSLHRIKLTLPWGHGNNAARVSITCRAARPDSAGAEVDVFSMILAIESWRQQPHDMHSGETAVLCETPNFRCLAQLLRHLLYQFGYDVSKPVQLLLPSGMADGTARVLDVLLTI
jgi:hypothetical protein